MERGLPLSCPARCTQLQPPQTASPARAPARRALRGAIMARMARWLKEAAASDGAIYGRMLATAGELHAALAAL